MKRRREDDDDDYKEDSKRLKETLPPQIPAITEYDPLQFDEESGDEEKSTYEPLRYNYKEAKKIISKFVEDNFNEDEYHELGISKYGKKLFDDLDMDSIVPDEKGIKPTTRGLFRVFKNCLKNYAPEDEEKPKKSKKKKKTIDYKLSFSQRFDGVKDFTNINDNIDNMLHTFKKKYKKNPFLCDISLEVKSVK